MVKHVVTSSACKITIKKRTQYESDLQRAQDASHEHVMDRMYGQALGCDWLMGLDGCNNQD